MVHHLKVVVSCFFGLVEVVDRLSTAFGETLKDCTVIVDVVGEAVAIFVVVSFDSMKTCVEYGHGVGDDVDRFAGLEETSCHS